jgi:hypothetical protein
MKSSWSVREEVFTVVVAQFAQQFAGLLPGARDRLPGGTPAATGAPEARDEVFIASSRVL